MSVAPAIESQTLPAAHKTITGPADWRALSPWYLAELLNCFGCTLFTSGSYLYAKTVLGLSPADRLWLAAGWGFTYTFFALLAGWLSDRWGPQRLVFRMAILGIGSASLSLLVLFWPRMHNAWGLFATMTAYNLTCTQMWPPMESAISRMPTRVSLMTRMTIYNLIWSGAGFGALFTVGTIAQLGWHWIYVIPAISMAGVVALLVFCTMGQSTPETPTADHTTAPADPKSDQDPALARRSTTLLHMAWLANAMAYVAITVVIPLMPTLADKAGVRSLAAVGLFQSPWALLRFVGFILMWKWTGWHYSVRWMLGAYVALAATFAVMLLSPANIVIFLTAQAIFGIAIALLYASSLYYAMHVSKGAGGHAGLHEALIGAGVAIGPMAGALAGTGAQAIPSITLAVCGVLALGFIGLAIMGARASKSRTIA